MSKRSNPHDEILNTFFRVWQWRTVEVKLNKFRVTALVRKRASMTKEQVERRGERFGQKHIHRTSRG